MRGVGPGRFLLVVISGIAMAPALPARAQTEGFLRPAEPGSPGAASRTQRFVFRDFDRGDGTMLAAWIEDVAAAVESQVGRNLPFRRFEMVRVSAAQGADGADGSVYAGQGFADSLLQQRIVLTNPERVSEDAFREAMVKVLLERYVLAAAPSKRDSAEPMRVPDWLAVGMAHTIDTARKRSDAEFVVDRWRQGDSRTVEECLRWVRLPPGASNDKAFCGLLVSWLSRDLQGRLRWYDVLLRIADGDAIDLEWIADTVLHADSALAVEKQWDLWLARQTLVHRNLGTVDPDRIDRVRDLLDIRLTDYGFSASPGAPDRLTVYDLADRREEAWAQRIADRLSGKLQAVSIGQAPEFVTVIDAFRDALLAVARGRRPAPSSGSLTRDFQQAEADLARLEQDLTLRSQYLQGVERNASVPADSPVATPEPPSVEDQRRGFLDRVQQQRAP